MTGVELDELLRRDTAASWGEALFGVGRHFGFEKTMFGLSGSRHARLDNAFTQTNYPDAWRERYDAERYAHVDPTVTHCLGSTLPIVWQPALFRSQTQRTLYEDSCSHGLCAGVSFPIH